MASIDPTASSSIATLSETVVTLQLPAGASGVFCERYRYENRGTKKGRLDFIYIVKGWISWETKNGYSDWNGKFQTFADGRIQIDFDPHFGYQGNESTRNRTDLRPTENIEVWEGYDCGSRRIRLIKLPMARLQWCRSCHDWVLSPEAWE